MTTTLVQKRQLSEEEAQRIRHRERQGENLIVNHIAIPHCWSEHSRPFCGYFITLERALRVEDETVRHLLIACASAENRQELKIFSYLASALNSHSPETIDRLSSYDDFIALLK